MSEKRQLIEQMLEMQRKFINYEHANGIDPQDYWAGTEGHPLHGYKDTYAELATRLIDLAHQEKGSKR